MENQRKIRKENIQDILALTPMQEGLLFQYLLNPESEQYFEQLSVRISGQVEKEVVIKAVQHVVDSNEMLRVIFKWAKIEKPVQIILKEQELAFHEFDLSGSDQIEQRLQLLQIKENDRKQRFDLETGPLFRIILCKLGQREYELILSNHHILYDGWSTGLIVREFLSAYEKLIQNEELKIPVKTRFKEYIKWCQKINSDEQEQYWRDYLSGYETRAVLKTDGKNTEELAVATYIAEIPGKMMSNVESLTRDLKVTLSSFLIAIFGILLQKYTNSSDLLFGTTVSGRTTEIPGVENIVGLFINTLPVRAKAESTIRFIDYLINLHTSLQERSSACITTPVSDIKSYSELSENEKLFDKLFVVENYPMYQELRKLHSHLHITDFSTFSMTHFDLVFEILTVNQLIIQIRYNPGIFNKETIQRMSRHYLQIIESTVIDPAINIGKIQMISAKEREQLLYEWNNTTMDFPHGRLLQEFFEATVAENSEKLAVLFGKQFLSYRELNERANQLARVLRECGVGPEQIVGVLTPRSLEMIIGIWAIIKAGGAYLPLDPEHPRDRIEYALNDSGANVLLSYTEKIKDIYFTGTVIELTDETIWARDNSNLKPVNSPNNMIYLLYTSGSTGKAKGVMIEHVSVVNILLALNQQYPPTETDTYLLKTSITFDVSVSELFGWFWGNGRLAVLEPGGEKDPKMIVQAVSQHSVTRINFVPSMLKVFLDNLRPSELAMLQKVRYFFVAGEAITPDLVQKFYRTLPGVLLENLYGPTEATIYATLYSCGEMDKKDVPIGKPLPNYRAYIVDKDFNLQPVGVPGELCLAGIGLACGYLNHEKMTRDNFMENPFEYGGRIYRTGDLARWLPDGNIQFLGRLDYQVKIRGYRVELGEIEKCIMNVPSVQSTVVVDKEDMFGNRYLVAYLVARGVISEEEIKNFLSKELPEYMIPTQLIQVEQMPLTLSGKIDRKALPEVRCDNSVINDTALPSTETEKRLAKIWSEILEVDRIGLHTNFFALGGQSLKVIQISTKIQKEFMVEVRLKDIYQQPTIYQMAKVIENANTLNYLDIQSQPDADYYELSFSQKRLWILDQLEQGDGGYIISHIHTFTEAVDRNALERACQALVERHDSLRTTFIIVDGEPKQKIDPDFKFKLNYLDFRGRNNLEELVKREEGQHIYLPFNLERDLLFRGTLIQLSENCYKLMLAIHHIVADGWSMDIIQRELTLLYQAFKIGQSNPFKPLPVQYKDYTIWHNRVLAEGKMSKHREFWLKKLQKPLSILSLPFDTLYSDQSHNRQGAVYQLLLSGEVRDQLLQLARSKELSLSVVLLAGFTVYLSRLTGERDVIFAGPATGRNQENVKNIIGLFINTVLFRNTVEWDVSFEQFIDEVQANLIDILEGQDYPFELLAQELNLSFEGNMPTVTSVFFNMLNFTHSSIVAENLKLGHYELTQKMKFDLGCYFTETDLGILIHCEYRTALFQSRTIQYLMDEFAYLLTQVGENYWRKIGEYNLFSKKRVLQEEQISLTMPYQEFTKEEIGQSISSRFEKQVRKYPDKIAVKDKDNELTYAQLNEQSNKLACWITKWLNDPFNMCSVFDDREQKTIALLFDQGCQMIIGMMGVLKSGQIYVPVDPTYPVERLVQILLDAKPVFLITNTINRELANLLVEKLINPCMILQLEETEEETEWNINSRYPMPDQIAYILYTSGSTGRPKGVFQSHQNVLYFIRNYTNRLHISHDDRLTLLSSYSFDAAVMDIYGALLNGATLYTYNLKEPGNLPGFADWLIQEQITIYHSVPTVFRYFINTLTGEKNFPDLRLIVMGGEVLLQKDLEKFKEHFAKHTVLVNGLGPTESTVTLQYFINIETNVTTQTIPVGYPIEETEVLILDDNGKEVSVFQVGEIVIKSPYLAIGYWQMPEETGKVFGPDPRTGVGRVYWSGDLGQYMANGSICFIGRKDDQVKVRGYRIEVNEVEAVLDHLQGIQKSAVIAQPIANGEIRLVAYYVSEPGKVVDKETIREELSTRLPEYMLPDQLIPIETLPLTLTGKINRKALPLVEEQNIDRKYQKPQNPLEEKLALLWSEVLEIDRVGRSDNFFELGGHSLKAMLLLSKIHREFNVELPIRDFFKRPILRQMGESIESAFNKAYSKIPMALQKEYYEVSAAQMRIYMLQQLDLSSTGYNMPNIFSIKGKLNLEKIERVLHSLIARHESLRTSFDTVGEKVVQRINEKVHFKVEFKEAINQNIDQIIRAFIRPFDLGKSPLIRVGVIRINEDSFILMFDMHHIISDGTSMGILVKDFVNLYENRELEELRIQYKDYAEWHNNHLKTDLMKRQKEYWIQTFSGELPVLNMPTDYSRPAIQNFEGDSVEYTLDRQITKNLKKIATDTGSTLFMVLLSGVNILISKYTGQDDIVIGTPITNRFNVDLEKIIGIFVNTIALRNHPQGKKNYDYFLNEVKEKVLLTFENQDYPFEELVGELNLRRDLSRNPLFDIMFVMQNMESVEFNVTDLKISRHNYRAKRAKFDLLILANEVDDEIRLSFEYCTRLFKKETVERIIYHFEKILSIVILDLQIKLSDIEMLTEKEKNTILVDYNSTYVNYDREKTLIQLFEEQVEKNPDNIAVFYKDRRLTYRDLNERANKIARALRERGIRTDSIVGVLFERSFEMLTGIFGVLKAGGAYLPLDPENPEERISFILNDSRADILLTHRELDRKVKFNGEIIDLDDAAKLSYYPVENLVRISQPKDLAYVIYTSGSTGKPKGVLIEHRSVINILTNLQNLYPLLEDGTYLLKTSYAFDVSVTELFGWFMANGRIAILPQGGEKNLDIIVQTISKFNITHVNFVPSMLNVFLQGLDEVDLKKINSLKYLLVAGEPFPRDLARRCAEKLNNVTVENIYGPTETTIYVSRYSIKDLKDEILVPIGKPLNNVQVYILSKDMRLLPTGVPGELYISGECLARGYFNRRDLTSEKFVDNPFNTGEKMYRTGDLARWLPDGNIEFLGRMDYQVKIRGFRIELGEIESQILRYKDIKETVVISREDKQVEKYLSAYLVSETQIVVRELRDFLLKNLPEYMVPLHLIQLDKLPLNVNGKVDRNMLPEPCYNIESSTAYLAPENDVEKTLVILWKDVLGLSMVGVRDNFFELGGHSLKAIALSSKIQKELGVEFTLGDIFTKPTIKELAQSIINGNVKRCYSIQPVEDSEYYPLSSAQRRIFLQWQLAPKSIAYNMLAGLILKGKLDQKKVKNTILQLVERHEAFRTSFEMVNGRPMQKIHNQIEFSMDYTEIPEESLGGFVQGFIKPFNLHSAPLLRVVLIRMEEGKHLLLFDMHHIIFDGVSLNVITRDFNQLYEGLKLPELKIQYKDFAVWHNLLLDSEEIENMKTYWLKRLDNFIYTELPTRKLVTGHFSKGKSMQMLVEESLVRKITVFCSKNQITKFTFMLAVFKLILMRIINQTDITLGIPVAGRKHEQLENIVGVFLNILVIRSEIKNNEKFTDYLHYLNNLLIESQEHQDYPYEYIYTNVKERFNFRGKSLFSILFNFMPYHPADQLKFDGLIIEQYALGEVEAKYGLSLFVNEGKNDIILKAVFTDSLEDYLIENILNNFSAVSEVVLSNEEILVNQIILSSTNNMEEYLQDFDVEFDNQEFF